MLTDPRAARLGRERRRPVAKAAVANRRPARARGRRGVIRWTLLIAVATLGAWTYGLELPPVVWPIQQLRDVALGSSDGSEPTASAPREPRLELESERTWVRAGHGFALLHLRNEGDAALEASEGMVRCTALDARRAELGRWQAGDLGLLTPGEEITLRVGIPLRKGQLRSMDCRLAE